MNKTLSNRLTNFKFFCTLMILFMHLVSAGVRPGRIYDFLVPITRLAVPAFFMVSGYLLARHVEPEWYRNLLRKRFKSLVVPYFVMNTLMIPLLFVYHNIFKLGNWAAGGLGFDWYSVSRIYGLSFYYHPAVGVLWYVRCLVFFVLLSPLLLVVIRRSKAWALSCLLSLLAVVAVVEGLHLPVYVGHFFYSFFNLRGLFFFALGMVLMIYGARIVKGVRWISLLEVAVVGVLINLFEHFYQIPGISILAWMCWIYVIWCLVPSIQLPNWIAASTFALFVLHQMFYMASAFAISKFGLSHLFANNPLVLLPLALTMLAIFAITYVIRNFAPRVGEILFGGRC